MAFTSEAKRLTTQNKTVTQSTVNESIKLFGSAFPLLLRGDYTNNWEAWTESVYRVASQRRKMSALTGAQYYALFREAEGIKGRAIPKLQDGLNREQFDISMRATVLSTLYKGSTSLLTVEDPVSRNQIERAAQRDALTKGSIAFSRHVVTGSRETIIQTSLSDRESIGWSRVASGNACSFCAMLASRGPSYLTEETANFEAHDACSCSAEPSFSEDQPWPTSSQEYADLWAESTEGLSGSDAQIAFRRKLENREAPSTDKTKPDSRASKAPASAVDSSKSTDELRATLSKLEASNEKFSSSGTRARIDALKQEIASRS